MAEGPPPFGLIRRLETAVEGEPIDQILFSMGIIMGNILAQWVPAEDQEEVISGIVDAIRVGIRGPLTEH